MVNKPLNSLSALELIVLCGSTDDLAVWNEFINYFQPRILLFLHREWRACNIPGNENGLIRDLVQEVYLRLLANDRRALREFSATNDQAVFGYLASIARSVVTDYVRHETRQKRTGITISLNDPTDSEKKELPLIDRLPASEDQIPDRVLEEQLAPEQIRALLKSTLSGANAERDALIFVLHVINGLTAREISSMPTLNMTINNVEAVIRRTRERLRVGLSRSNPSKLSV